MQVASEWLYTCPDDVLHRLLHSHGIVHLKAADFKLQLLCRWPRSGCTPAPTTCWTGCCTAAVPARRTAMRRMMRPC